MDADGLKGIHPLLRNERVLANQIWNRCDESTKAALSQVCKEWNRIFGSEGKGKAVVSGDDQPPNFGGAVVRDRDAMEATPVNEPMAIEGLPFKKSRLN